MPDYSYTHGASDPLNRLRLLIGDHRGTAAASGGWVFSNNELSDVLTIAASGLKTAGRICLQIRANREALNAGVSGTVDTSDRPASIINALRSLERLDLPGYNQLPITQITNDADFSETDLEED